MYDDEDDMDPVKEAASVLGSLLKMALVPIPAGDPNAAAQQAQAAPPGAGGMPPDAGGGIPPELMAAAAQQMQAPPQAAAPEAPPPAEPAPAPAPAPQMTPDDIRSIIREELNGGAQGQGQQGGSAGGKGGKSNHNELIKNISVDQFHTKKMLEVLFEHLGVPLPSFSDPNRHPETGLPASQSPSTPAKSASDTPAKVAYTVEDDDTYETTGGVALDYPPPVLRNAANSTTLAVMAALKGSRK